MHFEGSFQVNAPREKVWNFLLDPNSLSKSLPDCQDFKVLGEDSFSAKLKIGVSHIKGSMNFKFNIVEKQPPSHGKLVGKGSGIGSVVEFEAAMDLSEVSKGQTVITWKADGKVGGLIAGVASRLLGPAADRVVEQMFGRMKAHLEESVEG